MKSSKTLLFLLCVCSVNSLQQECRSNGQQPKQHASAVKATTQTQASPASHTDNKEPDFDDQWSVDYDWDNEDKHKNSDKAKPSSNVQMTHKERINVQRKSGSKEEESPGGIGDGNSMWSREWTTEIRDEPDDDDDDQETELNLENTEGPTDATRQTVPKEQHPESRNERSKDKLDGEEGVNTNSDGTQQAPPEGLSPSRGAPQSANITSSEEGDRRRPKVITTDTVNSPDRPGPDEYDVLWTHEQLLKPEDMHFITSLSKSQRMNQVVGSAIYATKRNLQSINSKAIVRRFMLENKAAVETFTQYAKEHPNSRWLRKNAGHRGVELTTVKEIVEHGPTKDTFIEEFVENPLLIDGHKFDISVFVLITSLLPLRAYIYDDDILVRLTGKPYAQFNPKDPDTYAVNPNRKTIWQMPTMKQRFNETGWNRKHTVFHELDSRGIDSSRVWRRIQEVVGEVFAAGITHMHKATKQMYKGNLNIGNPNRFFQLTRWDFMLDVNGHVYLMEANASPNMTPSREGSDGLPEKIINFYPTLHRDLFEITGIAKYSFVNHSNVQTPAIHRQHPTTYLNLPNLPFCENHCSALADSNSAYLCQLCEPVHVQPSILHELLHEAQRENAHKFGFARVYPPANDPQETLDQILAQMEHETTQFKCKLHKYDRLVRVWLLYRCKLNYGWCR